MGSEDLHTIVYTSESREPATQDQLLALLRRARRNNRRLDITGLLLYRNQRFIQILEGPREAVQTIYSIIGVDPMHRSVTTLVDMPVSHRKFMEWSMAFTKITDEMAESVPGFSYFLKDQYPHDLGEDPGTLLETLAGFRGFLN